MPILAGVRVSREQTLELAAMLTRDGSDHTARVLLEATTLSQEFIALSTDDREAVLAVLDRPTGDLVELRSVLYDFTGGRSGMLRSHKRRAGFPARS